MPKKAGKKSGARAKGSQPNGRLTADDLFVRRNQDGDLIPISVAVPAFGGKAIMILPTTIGSLKGITNPELDCVEWTLEDKVRYVTSHVVDPDLRELTMEDIERDVTLWDLDMLLIAAVQAGGPQRQAKQEKKA